MYEESKVLKSLSRVIRIDIPNKKLNVPREQNLGIKRLGMIDYLVKYCGWVRVNVNEPKVKIVKDIDYASTNKKKDAKQHPLTDKTKRK